MDLLVGNIPVGTDDREDGPRYVATTNNASRAYVSLELSGRVAVVDVASLQQLDTNLDESGINPIDLPSGAKPGAIATGSSDQYAYVTDRQIGAIYVIDINPASPKYNQYVETIEIEDAPKGIRQMAVNSDRTRLFVTVPNPSGAGKGQILVYNIDPKDRPANSTSNGNNWHRQIGKVDAGLGVEGIAATPDPLKMVFTNRNEDAKGFGLLEITINNPSGITAKTKYAQLGLGSVLDYFDVNEAFAVTVTNDGKYAFVAARNGRLLGSGIESIDGDKAGSNIGIISDPLTNPKLVAATRPIPGGLASGLALSSNNRYLYATFPGLKSTFGFDVEQIIQTVESTDPSLMTQIPIDEINPAINMASEFRVLSENPLTRRSVFGVPDGSNRMPIAMGENPASVAIASDNPIVEIVGPVNNSTESDLTPTFQWKIYQPGDDCEDACSPDGADPNQIEYVKLYVSVFDKDNGLLPLLWKPENAENDVDYNPNRVLTATWRNGQWTLNNGEIVTGEQNTHEQFTLPSDRKLTAGQTYHWAVEVKFGNNGVEPPDDREVESREAEPPVVSKFKTAIPSATNDKTFTSVTVLTRGLESPLDSSHSELIERQVDAIAWQIQEAGGEVMKYAPGSGQWQSVIYDKNLKNWVPDADENLTYGKPLVLMADWMEGIPDPTKLHNAGFAEAAADTLFASLVQLDQKHEGNVGAGASLYDNKGNLIRKQGAVFNSPLHFIGFGQGAVVNSEIIQRLGTFFPHAGGIVGLNGLPNPNRDLQMTTVDPHDYDPNSPQGTLPNILDPYVWAWKNVTYADNYYQTVGTGNTLNGKALSGQVSGKNWTADWDVLLNDRAKFMTDDGKGLSHRAAVGWYAGTGNLNESQLPPENGETVFRRLGDLYEKNITDPTKSWYTPDYIGTNFNPNPGAQNAPWEGIGTGWFYSVAGGGFQLRPYKVDGTKKSKEQLGNFEDYLKNYRVPVYEDNTYTDTTIGRRLQGDYAVPTLFNGNFDAISNRFRSQNIPGWSFYNSGNDVLQRYLRKWDEIGSLADYRDKVGYNPTQPNYALKMGGSDGVEEIVHNPFVVPEWGVLRLDIHVPNSSLNKGGRLKVYLEEVGSPNNLTIGEISLEEADPKTTTVIRTRLDGSTYSVRIPDNYEYDQYTIGYGSSGFETFHIDVDPKLRGKVAKLRLELQGSEPVYVDNVFFKSESLKWGNPTNARNDSQYETNFLIEKPQYSLSYNRKKNTINWVAWKLDKTWLGDITRPSNFGFAEDRDLDKTGWYKVQDIDYDALFLKDQNGQAVRNNEYLFPIDRGHMAPAADRSRTLKDLHATFLTTNLLPQDKSNNRGVWETLENHVRRVVQTPPSQYSLLETYVIAGGFDSNPQYTGISRNQSLNPLIHLPLGLWKVVLTAENNSELPTAGHFAVYMGNEQRDNWGSFTQNIQELEGILNSDSLDYSPKYKFLSNVPEFESQAIKNQNLILYPGIQIT